MSAAARRHAYRDWTRPILADCTFPTCQQARGQKCKTRSGADAPFHEPRELAVAGMTDAEADDEFDKLDAERATQRAAARARARRPLDPETLASRAAFSAAWDRICREVR
jgi:hypothetical protein